MILNDKYVRYLRQFIWNVTTAKEMYLCLLFIKKLAPEDLPLSCYGSIYVKNCPKLPCFMVFGCTYWFLKIGLKVVKSTLKISSEARMLIVITKNVSLVKSKWLFTIKIIFPENIWYALRIPSHKFSHNHVI